MRKSDLFAFSIVLLLAAVILRLYLFNKSDPAAFDSTPLKKAEINAPFITSQQKAIDRMIEIAELAPDDLVFDLGCGDGRIVINAVAKSGCRGVGIDIEPDRIRESRENARASGVEDKIEFVEKDIFQVDLVDCTVAMMYLNSWMIEKLEGQFEKMKPGSRIVTQDYWIEQVRPERVVLLDGIDPEDPERNHALFLYTIPLKRDPTMMKGKPPQPDDAINPAQ